MKTSVLSGPKSLPKSAANDVGYRFGAPPGESAIRLYSPRIMGMISLLSYLKYSCFPLDTRIEYFPSGGVTIDLSGQRLTLIFTPPLGEVVPSAASTTKLPDSVTSGGSPHVNGSPPSGLASVAPSAATSDASEPTSTPESAVAGFGLSSDEQPQTTVYIHGSNTIGVRIRMVRLDRRHCGATSASRRRQRGCALH